MDLSLFLNLILCFMELSVVVQGLIPTIDGPAANVTALEGETAILECSVSNLGEYKVAWLDKLSALLTVGDNRITEDNRFKVEHPTTLAWNLHIENVATTDQGRYLCRINTDPVTSKTVGLEVLVPAKIRTDLSSSDTVLKEGETLVLICNVTGFPRPFVTWYKLVSGKKERLFRSGEVLIISNVSREDGGTYECVAFNGASANKKINVSIKLREPDPEIELPLVNVSVLQGSTVVLPCSVENLGEYTIEWLDQHAALLTVNQSRITDDGRFSVEHTAETEWNLRIQTVDQKDAGKYFCRVNTSAVTIKSVYLEVNVPVKIRDELSSEDKVLKEGEALLLVCNVTGIPKPIVTWYKLTARSKLELNVSGEVLLVPNVSKTDGGTYECTASNSVSESTSKQISVSILFAPKVTLLSKRVGQVRGGETLLDCKISARPAPDMYWLKGDTDIKFLDTDRYQTDLFSDTKDTTIHMLSLRIINLQEEDFGVYTCYARNKIGKDKDSVELYDFSVHFLTTTFVTTTPRLSQTTKYRTISNKTSSLSIKGGSASTEKLGVGSDGSTFVASSTVEVFILGIIIFIKRAINE